MPRRLFLLLCGTLAVAAMMLMQQRPISAANPSADLDQCRNGDQLHPVQCTGSAWVNGNAGASNAHWLEGDSIAYRMRFTNLAAGSHTLVIEWDTTQSGKHALDYITTVDRTETTAEPCFGVGGCTGSFVTAAIPMDANTGLGPSPGTGRWDQAFKLYNAGALGSINVINSSDYFLSGVYSGNSSTRLTITFNTSTPNPVLAWGGHIATRADWGVNNSAIAINGSPYHMRLISLDGSGGNQDRSLSSAAAIFPASLTIIKDVRTSTADTISSTEFTFTTTGPTLPSGGPEVPLGFSLWDDGTSNDATQPDRRTYNLSLFGSTNAVTVTEGALAQYDQFLVCQEDPGGLPQTDNSTPSTQSSTGTANITAEEGEIITCRYTNQLKTASLTVIKQVITDNGSLAGAGAFTIHVKDSNGNDVADSPKPGSSTGTVYNLAGGSYVVSENDPSPGYKQTSITGACDANGGVTLAPGDSKTCTITNDDVAPKLTLTKVVNNNHGGVSSASDFTLTATGTNGTLSGTGSVASGSNFKAGLYTLSESGPAGYQAADGANTYSCVVNGGNAQLVTQINLSVGDVATCTITNNDLKQSNGNSTTPSSSITLNDSASITNIRTIGGTYNVTFRLYKNAPSAPQPTCDATTLIFTATRDLALTPIANTSPALSNGTASTTGAASGGTLDSGSRVVNESGKYYWTVQMAADTNNQGVQEACGSELTNVTITNDGN